MNEELFELSEEMISYIRDLLSKAIMCNEKTSKYSNCALLVNGERYPLKVDDLPLLVTGCMLLPNMVNYLVNILPQFLYPYVVAYLQDLSSMREDPVTINELYDYLTNGYIHECSETED